METKHVLWGLAGAAVLVGTYYWWKDSQKSLSPKPGQANPVALPTSTPSDPAVPIPTSNGIPNSGPTMAFASPFFANRDTNPR